MWFLEKQRSWEQNLLCGMHLCMHTQALPWNQGGTAKDRVRFGNVSHGKGHGHLAVSFHFSIQAAFRWMINVYCKQCSYNRENEKKIE